jgi:hypothetical protein
LSAKYAGIAAGLQRRGVAFLGSAIFIAVAVASLPSVVLVWAAARIVGLVLVIAAGNPKRTVPR